MYSDQLQGVLRRHSVVFEAELCTLKCFQANIILIRMPCLSSVKLGPFPMIYVKRWKPSGNAW